MALILQCRFQEGGVSFPRVVKINFNGAVFKERNAIGVGVLAWNHERKFIRGYYRRLEGMCCPVVAKIYVASKAITLAKSFAAEVFLESDAAKVIKILSEETMEKLSTIGHLQDDVRVAIRVSNVVDLFSFFHMLGSRFAIKVLLLVEFPSISRSQMAEELAEILQKFELSSKEIDGIAIDLKDLQEGVEDCKGSLLGKERRDKISSFIGSKTSPCMLGATLRISGW
ncbi:hypothetical protein ACH5RR_015174 [Cinchona calisaya]|uniref:RNase H type-1 domain-containing protein n=1 Tax=Cinchona calisaya TaxID=153742 RepID=A0ABD2ZVH9_9GENT